MGWVVAASTVCAKNGSGFSPQSQHTPAWLNASERRVPLLCSLASCGSAAAAQWSLSRRRAD